MWPTLTLIVRISVALENYGDPYTSPFMVFSVTYYLELHHAITFYYGSLFLPTNVKLIVCKVYNISILLDKNLHQQ